MYTLLGLAGFDVSKDFGIGAKKKTVRHSMTINWLARKTQCPYDIKTVFWIYLISGSISFNVFSPKE